MDNICLTKNKELKIGGFDLAVKLNFEGEKRKQFRHSIIYGT